MTADPDLAPDREFLSLDLAGVAAMARDLLEVLKQDPAADPRLIEYVDARLVRPMIRRCEALAKTVAAGNTAGVQRDVFLLVSNALALGALARPNDWRQKAARVTTLASAKALQSDRAQAIVATHVRAYRATTRTKAGPPTTARAIMDAVNADCHALGIAPLKSDAIAKRIRRLGA